MSRTFASSTIISLLLAADVFANAGPPPLPKGRKVVEPPVRIEGTDKHPDRVFVLWYGALYFGQTILEVKNAEPIKLNFKTKDRLPLPFMLIAAVERKDFEKRQKDDPELKWLAEPPEGVLRVEVKPPETTAPVDAKDVPTTTYRVAIKDGKLTAEKVEPKKKDAKEPTGSLPPWTYGLLGSLSLAWLGLWFARRGACQSAAR